MPDNHKWVGQQMGGPPDMAESYEWVEYCDNCGMERPGSDVDIELFPCGEDEQE